MTMSEDQWPETIAQVMSGEEEDVQLTEEDIQKKRKAILGNKLSREEREDIIHSLEHIVTVGSSVRRNEKRRREWKSRQQDTEQEDVVVIDSEENGASRPDAALPRMMHAEDVRIMARMDVVGPTGQQRLESIHRIRSGITNMETVYIRWPFSRRDCQTCLR